METESTESQLNQLNHELNQKTFSLVLDVSTQIGISDLKISKYRNFCALNQN